MLQQSLSHRQVHPIGSGSGAGKQKIDKSAVIASNIYSAQHNQSVMSKDPKKT